VRQAHGPALQEPDWYDRHVGILAAVDDLLFRSKIRAVAKHVNAEIAFAVIFDLNSQKSDPVVTIAALKADPALAGVRTIAFASHVHVDLIDAARAAGADQVMARSQFAGNLADILASAL